MSDVASLFYISITDTLKKKDHQLTIGWKHTTSQRTPYLADMLAQLDNRCDRVHRCPHVGKRVEAANVER